MAFVPKPIRKCALLLCLAGLSGAVLAGCDNRWKPIYEVRNQTFVRSEPALDLKQVESRIVQAARFESWQTRPVKPGQLRATRRWQRHVAVVTVNYSTDRYDIIFQHAENLQREGYVHRRYNQLVRQLDAEISRQLQSGATRVTGNTVQSPPPVRAPVRVPPKAAAPEIPDGFLTAEQIKRTFTSRTYDRTLRSGVTRSITFRKGGKLHGVPHGAGGGVAVDSGGWSIAGQDRLCTRWDRWNYGKQECFRVKKRGKHMILHGSRPRDRRTFSLVVTGKTVTGTRPRNLPDGGLSAEQINAFLPGLKMALSHRVNCGAFDNLGGDSCHLTHEFRHSGVIRSRTVGHSGSSEEKGRWWVKDDNSLCLKWPSWFHRKQRCGRVLKYSNRITHLHHDGKSAVYLIERK